MKYLLITVGTSALTNKKIGLVKTVRHNDTLLKEVERYLEARDKSPNRWLGLSGQLLEAHLRYWEQIDNYVLDTKNFDQTAAELASTWIINRDLTGKFDRVVLLTTDTDESVFAGNLVKSVMEQSPAWKQWNLSNVQNWKIEGLKKEFKDPLKRLTDALTNLGVLITDEVHFNITGGYKALAAVVGTLAVGRGATLHYVNDEFPFAVSIENKVNPVPGPKPVEKTCSWVRTEH